MQTRLREKKKNKKNFGTYAVITPLNWSLHERRDHSHTHTHTHNWHTTAKHLSACTLWRVSRLTLVACVYKAPSAVSSVITVAGMREKITAAIRGSNARLPPFVILSIHAPPYSILSWIKWVQLVSRKSVIAAEGQMETARPWPTERENIPLTSAHNKGPRQNRLSGGWIHTKLRQTPSDLL